MLPDHSTSIVKTRAYDEKKILIDEVQESSFLLVCFFGILYALLLLLHVT